MIDATSATVRCTSIRFGATTSPNVAGGQDRGDMDIAPDDRRDALPAEDLLVSFDGRRVIRRADDGEFIIGREGPPSHIHIDHPALSRLPIRLVPGARWVLIDYASRNGVYVHGRRIEYETPITDCMTVHLG